MIIILLAKCEHGFLLTSDIEKTKTLQQGVNEIKILNDLILSEIDWQSNQPISTNANIAMVTILKNMSNISHWMQKFAKSSYWTDHRRVNTGEKPYECGSCNMKFAHLASLTYQNWRVHAWKRLYYLTINVKNHFFYQIDIWPIKS
jgi:hypothetical protein